MRTESSHMMYSTYSCPRSSLMRQSATPLIRTGSLGSCTRKRVWGRAAQPDPAAASAPYQLPGAAGAVGQRSIDEEIKPYLVTQVESRTLRRCDREGDGVAVIAPLPSSPHTPLLARAVGGLPDNQTSVFARGHNEPSLQSLLLAAPEIHLNAVGMNLVGLVVQSEWGTRGIANQYFRLADTHREIQCLIVPVKVGAGGELFRPGIRILAPAVLIFVVKLQRSPEVETVQGSIQLRCVDHVQCESLRFERTVDLHHRLKGTNLLPGSPET